MDFHVRLPLPVPCRMLKLTSRMSPQDVPPVRFDWLPPLAHHTRAHHEMQSTNNCHYTDHSRSYRHRTFSYTFYVDATTYMSGVDAVSRRLCRNIACAGHAGRGEGWQTPDTALLACSCGVVMRRCVLWVSSSCNSVHPETDVKSSRVFLSPPLRQQVVGYANLFTRHALTCTKPDH